MPRNNRQRQMDLPGLVQGEVTAQTPNGTAHSQGSGWNWNYPWGDRPQVQTGDPLWNNPNTNVNRTGE